MFVEAGKWPRDAIPEEAEPPALLLGPGQSWAERKQVKPDMRCKMDWGRNRRSVRRSGGWMVNWRTASVSALVRGGGGRRAGLDGIGRGSAAVVGVLTADTQRPKAKDPKPQNPNQRFQAIEPAPDPKPAIPCQRTKAP